MKLEFLWIEKHSLIRNQGFNFNPSALYTFDYASGELLRTERTGIGEDFFKIEKDGVISSISALVGANGTGKSTILEFIAGFLTSGVAGGIMITDKFVFAKINTQVFISKNWQGQVPEILDKFQISNYNRLRDPFIPEKDKVAFVTRSSYLNILGNVENETLVTYYSGDINTEHTNRVYQNLLSLQDEFESSYYLDLSDVAIISADMGKANADKAIYTGVDPILAYRAGESKRVLDLLNSAYRDLIPFSFDRITINIKLSDIDSTFFASYDEIAFKPLAHAIKKELLHSPQLNEKLISQIERFEVFGFSRYFGEKFDKFQQEKNIDVARVILLHQLLFRSVRERVLKTMGDFTHDQKYNAFLELMDDLSAYFFDNTPYDVQCESFLTRCERNVESIGLMRVKEFNDFLKKFKSFSGPKITELNWQINGYSTQAASRKNFDSFVKAISAFERKSGFKFSITSIFELDLRGLSTGEKQFLKLFSRLGFSFLFNPKSKLMVKNMILLLDEFDLGFHPRWQQKYLKELIKYLELIVKKSGKELSFQVIFTSHSPFIVSDLPRECINFIRKSEDDPYSYVDSSFKHHATFGENIHDLFKESFFLDGALMGDFAKMKINQGFKNLQDLERPLDQGLIKTLIRITGEPLIKLKLSEMYADRTGESNEIANLRTQQQYIDKRIKELESNVANKKDDKKEP